MIRSSFTEFLLRWRTTLGRQCAVLTLLGSCLLNLPDAKAEIRLPRLVSDGMILQRDAKLTVWGWGAKDEKVALSFKNKPTPPPLVPMANGR